MMSLKPTAAYAERAGLVLEQQWDPQQFTFKGARATLTHAEAAGCTLVLPRHIHDVSMGKAKLKGRRLIAPVHPIHFSPSNAVDFAKAVYADPWQGGTFLIGKSPSYDLIESTTITHVAMLSNAGHDIGIMVELNNRDSLKDLQDSILDLAGSVKEITGNDAGIVSFNTVGIPAREAKARAAELKQFLQMNGMISTYDPLFQNPAITICTSSNGLYKGGHPDYAFTQESGRKLAIFNMIPDWYSQDPLLPLQRLEALPEVFRYRSRVQAEYLDHVKIPILGAEGTYARRERVVDCGQQAKPNI